MPRYRVELNGVVAVRYSIEVDAESSEVAMEAALSAYPESASLWDQHDGAVGQVEPEGAEEIQ